MMRIRVFHLHNKKEKGMSPFYFFSEISIEIMTLIILVKNCNLLKFIKASANLELQWSILLLTNKKTFQMQILCLKFVKLYIFKNFEPQNVMRIK